MREIARQRERFSLKRFKGTRSRTRSQNSLAWSVASILLMRGLCVLMIVNVNLKKNHFSSLNLQAERSSLNKFAQFQRLNINSIKRRDYVVFYPHLGFV